MLSLISAENFTADSVPQEISTDGGPQFTSTSNCKDEKNDHSNIYYYMIYSNTRKVACIIKQDSDPFPLLTI